jgi:hypothetical protein
VRKIRKNLRAGIALAVIGLCACSRVTQTLPSVTPPKHEQYTPADGKQHTPTDGKLPIRPVYRYSVIPGGAYSSEELARARRVDRAVEAHYTDFGHDATVQRAPADLYVYVSYRKSNRVYWTTDKRRILEGEKILSDGKNLARARCGNRLSFVPRQPTMPDLQPPDNDLGDTEARDIASLEPTGPPLFYPEYDLPTVSPFSVGEPGLGGLSLSGIPAAGAPATLGAAAYGFPPPYWLPPLGMLPPGAGIPASSSNVSSGSGGPDGSSPVGALDSRTSTPEPASGAIFAGGLLLACSLILKLRRTGRNSR